MMDYLPLFTTRPNWPFIAKTVRLLLSLTIVSAYLAFQSRILDRTTEECSGFSTGIIAFCIYIACGSAALLIFSFSWYDDAEIKHFGHWLITLYSGALGMSIIISFLFQLFAVPVGAAVDDGWACLETSKWTQGFAVAWFFINLPFFAGAIAASGYGCYRSFIWFMQSATVVEDPPIPL
jgi:hypothetical protein